MRLDWLIRLPAVRTLLIFSSSPKGQPYLNPVAGGQAPTQISVTGHSIGGGVASIFATWAALQWQAADVELTTFGSVKVGNKAFAQVTTAVWTWRGVRGLQPHAFVGQIGTSRLDLAGGNTRYVDCRRAQIPKRHV